MKTFGIIGRPLGHSFSKAYFEQNHGVRYLEMELGSIDELPAVLAANPLLGGFNVTIPYKREVVPFLDALSPEAEEIGAVNCVRISDDGKLTGYNTDAWGFAIGLENLLDGEGVLRALVLGDGGAAAAVKYVLGQKRIDYQVIKRSDYASLTSLVVNHSRLIINCTPLGMFPNIQEKPDIPYEGLTARHFLYDLVYNPPLTEFLKEGKKRGARVLNGEIMLLAQAEKSWDIWQ